MHTKLAPLPRTSNATQSMRAAAPNECHARILVLARARIYDRVVLHAATVHSAQQQHNFARTTNIIIAQTLNRKCALTIVSEASHAGHTRTHSARSLCAPRARAATGTDIINVRVPCNTATTILIKKFIK